MKKKSSFNPWNGFPIYISKAPLHSLKSDNRTCRNEILLNDNNNNKHISVGQIVLHLLSTKIIGEELLKFFLRKLKRCFKFEITFIVIYELGKILSIAA